MTQIKGIYHSTLFRNIDTGFTVFKLKLTEYVKGYDIVYLTCLGTVLENYVSIPLILTGEFTEESYYEDEVSYSFKFTDIRPYINTENDILEYPAFKGIPQKTIKEMAKKFGPNIFEWDDNFSNLYAELLTIKGISSKRANVIYEYITYYKRQREFFEYINSFGEHPDNIDNFFLEFANNALGELKKHPYKYGKKLKLSFRCCDAIAYDNGFKANDRERIHALVFEAIKRAYSFGHTCFPLERILNGVKWTTKHFSAFPNEDVSIFTVFSVLNDERYYKKFKSSDGTLYYYLPYSYDNEMNIAQNIGRLLKGKINYNADINSVVQNIENALQIKYSERQKECFNLLKSDGVKVITGGPGTGKTTVVNGIIKAYEMLHPGKQIVLMAPTGRAAQRMSEVTDKEAGTVHRMLGVSERFENELVSQFNCSFPADLVIIDEASMIDNEMGAQILSALKNGVTLVFVGDIDQLPAVGAGNFLNSLISADIETVHLNVNYRQGKLSAIAENAERIRIGNKNLRKDDTFNIIKCETAGEIQQRALNIFTSLFNKTKPFETQMLNGVKKGPSGVITFNNLLQQSINSSPSLLHAGKYDFKLGDKIIVTENNYDDMCFNGDIGTIQAISEDKVTMNIGNREISYGQGQYSQIHLAYAMSIHKSQGSEYSNVIICLPSDSAGMLKRKLIYTAITRAKEKIYILYTGNALSKAIECDSDTERISNLTEFIKKGVS